MTLDMRTRVRPADWCAAVQSLPADIKPVRVIWQFGPELSTEADVFVNMRTNRKLREMLDVMCFRCM